MSTAHSPLRVLKSQADKIAAIVKAVERGETVADDPMGRIAASREIGRFKFAVVMDDKVLSIEIPWEKIQDTSEVGLAEFILKQMRESRDTVQ